MPTFLRTYGANPMSPCCIYFGCVDPAGGRVFPETMDFLFVTGGSCTQAQDGGVFSATATRRPVPINPRTGQIYVASDIAVDGCVVWFNYLCGAAYDWDIDPADYPLCGPFLSHADLVCMQAPVGFTPIFSCQYLDTRYPRKFWLTSTFNMARTKTIPRALITDTFHDYLQNDDCTWPDPPVLGTGRVVCNPACPCCVSNCITEGACTRCLPGVECCNTVVDGTPLPDDGCSCDIVPPGDGSVHTGNLLYYNDRSCDPATRCPGIEASHGTSYRWTFCFGCGGGDQDDIRGCDPYNCKSNDPVEQNKHSGEFHLKLKYCAQFLPAGGGGGSADACEGGDYEGCVATIGGDYALWYCTPTEMMAAQHRAWMRGEGRLHWVPSADEAADPVPPQRFRPCRHAEHDATCEVCHAVKYDDRVGRAVDLRMIGYGGSVYVAGPPVVPFVGGPGRTMKELNDLLGIREWAGCACAAIMAEMDRAGVAGCRLRRDALIAKLKANFEDGVRRKKIDADEVWGRAGANAWKKLKRYFVWKPWEWRSIRQDPISWLFDLAVRVTARRARAQGLAIRRRKKES